MKNRFHRLKEIFSSKIKPKMKNKKVFWGSIAGCAGLAIVLAGGFFLQAKGASKNQTETTVQSAEAKTGNISTTVEGTGTVSNGAATDVVVPTGIKVKEVLVESGDTVEEGQVLATLDEASIASELLEVKENIESVEDEIDDLSSDAQTEGTTEYLQAKVLNGELTELQEAETTLTGLLETQTITATCAGTVSSVNVEADTEITKSSGSNSSGSSSSGSSSGSSSSTAATGMNTASTSDSGSSDSTASTNTSASGTYSLMFLSASTSGTSTSSAESTTDTTEAQTQSAGSKDVYVSTESNTSETSDSEKITSVDVKVTAPKTGEKPQTTITETDQYTGTISWNCSTDTFEAGTSYTADIRLTAKDGYVFSAKILPEISGADVTSEVLENDAGQSVLRIKAKFTKTSAKDSSNDTGNSTGNSGNSSNGNTSNSGTTSGTASSGMASSENASNGSTSNGNASSENTSGKMTTDGTSVGTTSGASESGSSNSGSSGSAAGSSESSDSASTDGNSTSTQYSAYETAAFSIASDEKATVSINVDELDITSVKEGQTAKITLDAIDGEEFEGTITSVSSEASSGSSSAKYPVEITFDKTDDMRIGMTASASISIDEAEDAVLIPVDALQEKGNKTFVYTKKDSDGNLSGEVEVETGLSNGNKVEITSGLKSGDTVYYLKTTSSGNSDSQQNMQDMGGGPGGNGEAPSGDMGGNGGGPGGDGGEAPSGGPGGNSSN